MDNEAGVSDSAAGASAGSESAVAGRAAVAAVTGHRLSPLEEETFPLFDLAECTGGTSAFSPLA